MNKMSDTVFSPEKIKDEDFYTAPISSVVMNDFIDTTNQTIRNGSTIIADKSGIVSATNFSSSSVTVSSFNTNSISYVDIPGCTLTVTLTRTTKILAIYSANMGNTSTTLEGAALARACLRVDSSDEQGPTLDTTGFPTPEGVLFLGCSAATILTLESGTHTLKLRLRAVSYGDAYAENIILSIVVLGT